jgi:transposase
MLGGMRPPGTAKQLQKRREYAVELLKAGKSPAGVARAVSASRSSVSRWQAAYQADRHQGLQAKPIPGRPARLSPKQRAKLEKLLLAGPVAAGYQTDLWTLERVARLIRQQFGVRYHPGHVWRVLRGLGWSCQKPERRPTQRDDAAIAHWRRYVWPQLKKS